jgi:predicted RNA-binding protein associated with RNAse of E/G family
MGLPVKTLSRKEWSGEHKKESRRKYVSDGFFEGYVGLIRFSEVKKPLSASLNGNKYDIFADGVCWLQLAPKHENWWLTALYAPDGAFQQFYFDITDGSFIDGQGEVSFYDLMLDVVALPDGSIHVLDRDELDTALDDRFITPEQHAQALADGDKLINWLKSNFALLMSFCGRYFKEMINELK